MDKFGFVALQLVLEVILARLLLPKDYGVMGIVLVFTAIAVIFSEGGFSNALIHKQDRNEVDFSTVFYFNILVSIFLYIIVFFSAPFVEIFFDIKDLTLILRVVSISMILHASTTVHKTKLSIEMDFKMQAKISILAIGISGCLGIILAYQGLGVWSLVFQHLTMVFLSTIFLWLGYRWFPSGGFSIRALKKLFHFGSKILMSSIIQTLYFNIFPFIIGRILGVRSLGLYAKSSQFTVMPASTMTNVVQRVLFPFFSTYQNDDEKIFELNQKYTLICCLFFFPIFFTLAGMAEPLILLLLSERWSAMTDIFIVLCFSYILFPIIVNNMMLFQVKNKTSLFLKLEIITKIIGVIILLVTVKHGLMALVYGIMVQQILQFLITSFFIHKLIHKNMWKQIKIIAPLMIFSIMLFGAVHWILDSYHGNEIVKLSSAIASFILGYGMFYVLFYKKDIMETLLMIRKNN